MGMALKIDQAKIESVPIEDDGDNSVVCIMGKEKHYLLKQLADEYTMLRIAAVMVEDQLQAGETVDKTFFEALRRDVEFKELADILVDEFADFFPEVATLFGQLKKVRSDYIARTGRLDGDAGKKAESEMKKVMDQAEEEAKRLIAEASIEVPQRTT